MRRAVVGVSVLVLALLGLPALARASGGSGIEHLSFAAGPYPVRPGANLILTQGNGVPKPSQNGFMIRLEPNLRYALPNGKCCGKIPPTYKVHLHHAVWLSNGTSGQGEGNRLGSLYPFFASGEEKTALEFPPGYGYPVGAQDRWILNYMIHNLTANATKVYVTYDMEFVPESSPLAASITPVHPIWMDVQDHHIYPVFNVQRHSGRDGKFTYPEMAKHPYGKGPPLNEFTVDHPGTLIEAAGHLHPGGLYDQLDLSHPGVKPASNTMAGVTPGSVRLFRSVAHYFDQRGPVSWDLAMTVTAPNWRPLVKPGDVLRVSTTYETRRASWYEVMGIMVVWEAWNDTEGVDPFTHALDQSGHITHGHLAENNHYGGSAWVGVNPEAWAECATHKVIIAGFHYLPGDFTSKGSSRCIPTIKRGQSLKFVNEDASSKGTFGNPLSPNPFYLASIFHTVTSCKNPCTLNYGIAYPLANGSTQFDSGQLGVGIPGVGRLTWKTPADLPPGTYTFYCRIHPWMRGVFRILP